MLANTGGTTTANTTGITRGTGNHDRNRDNQLPPGVCKTRDGGRQWRAVSHSALNLLVPLNPAAQGTDRGAG